MERRTRVTGIVLLLSGVLIAQYLPIALWQVDPVAALGLVTITNEAAVFVAIPLGAGLIAASVAIRALATGVTAAFIRSQLGIAVVLILVGLLARALGPTAQVGASLGWFVLGLVSYVALPLGVALATIWPIERWNSRQPVRISPP